MTMFIRYLWLNPRFFAAAILAAMWPVTRLKLSIKSSGRRKMLVLMRCSM